MYQFMTSYIKWNYNFCLLPSWMWALLSMKLKKETFRCPCGQDKITSQCVLGFVYGRKQKEMPTHVVVPSSCHRARGTASLRMNTQCVLQEDSSQNDEVFKSTLFFPCRKIFIQLQTCTLFHKLSMFCHTFHHVRLTNNSCWPCTVDWKSILAVPIPPGHKLGISSGFNPGCGAFEILSLPGGRAFA